MELTDEDIAQHSTIHHVLGPVFLSHMLSPTVSDRKNILKLLQEWLVDEATELPDGLVVIRTGKVAFTKLEVLKSVAAVCTHAMQDEDEVAIQSFQLLKAVLGSNTLLGRVKHTDVSAELRPVVAGLGARLGDTSTVVRQKAFGAILAICRRSPSTVYVGLVVTTLAVWPAPEDAQHALGVLYALAVLFHTFGVKVAPVSALGDSTSESKRAPSPSGLVPQDRVLLFINACFAKPHKELVQPCYSALCDLQRTLGVQLETFLGKLEEPYQTDARRILQHSASLSILEDAQSFLGISSGSSPGSRRQSASDVLDVEVLRFNPDCRITKELLITAAKLPRTKEEPLSRSLERVLTLSLNNKGIDTIDNLHFCPNLKVLYLYDNVIPEVRNLEFASHLTHLYLNNNSIASLDGLQRLRSLKKLYLNYNRISHLDTISTLTNLQELYLSHQKLEPGQGLTLDASTLHGLQQLQILTLTHNNMEDVVALRQLGGLQQLDLSYNQLCSMDALKAVVQHCRRLRDLQIHNNPLAVGKYIDELVLASTSTLATIDTRSITAKEREFLRQLRTRRTSVRGPSAATPNPTGPAGLPPVQGCEVGRPRS